MTQLAWVVVVNLILGFSLYKIVDNSAHIGGLIGGAFLALFDPSYLNRANLEQPS